MRLEKKLCLLKIRKAMLFSDIEYLSKVDQKLFTQFGKIEAEIMKVKKQIVRNVKNDFQR